MKSSTDYKVQVEGYSTSVSQYIPVVQFVMRLPPDNLEIYAVWQPW
jgi:hypothetical protein